MPRYRAVILCFLLLAGCTGTPSATEKADDKKTSPQPQESKIAPPAPGAYRIYVTNEVSGDLSVIDSSTNSVIATVPLGKRPRGIHASPDRKTIYVALSGSPIGGPNVDDPTSGISIEGRRTAAHHFDATDGFEVEIVNGGLAVWERQGDAIAEHSNPAHAKRRARAKAANGDSGVLRWIVAVGDREPRNQPQRVVQREMPLSRTQRIRNLDRDSEWQLERRPVHPAPDFHHYRRETRRCGILS